MNKLMMAVAVAAAMLCGGCRVIKVDRSADGEYRAYYNSHWFSTEADSVTAGMSPDGTFSMSLSGVKSNPSEEFNKAMQTYTSAFVAIAQIAAAAYNPSASAASAGKVQNTVTVTAPAATNATTTAASATNATTTAANADCADGSCTPTP